MSNPSRDSYEDGKRHREKVERKYAKIQGLAALIETHEKMPEPDVDYIREAKLRLRNAMNQLKAMAGT
jgi:hypothetical protein